jgi:hypothetical protein
MDIEKILELASEKSLMLKKQLNPIWEIVLNFCEKNRSGNGVVEIYEYVQYTEIHLLTLNPTVIATKLVKEMSLISKFITIHTYLRGKECIISIDGRKTVFLYEKFGKIESKGNKESGKNDGDISEIKRLLFMSRELYHPNLFLDIVKGKLNQPQELFLEIIVKMLSNLNKTNEGRNGNLSLDIIGGRSRNIIIKKVHKHSFKNDSYQKERNNVGDVIAYIKKYFKSSEMEYVFTSTDNSNGEPLRVTTVESWNIIKKLKTDLNKKFNSMKYDRFYYEISQNHIFNDFRLKRINLIDKRGNKVVLSLYNNMEYEALPVLENNICHDFVKFRYMLYDICKKNEGNYENIISDSEIKSMIQTLKNGFASCKKMNELQYVGKYIDDRSVKINMGGDMKRNPLN